MLMGKKPVTETWLSNIELLGNFVSNSLLFRRLCRDLFKPWN